MHRIVLVLAAPVLACVASAQVDPVGFYTDKPSYTPDGVVQIHANWKTDSINQLTVTYRLRRVGSSVNLMNVPVTYPANTFQTQPIPYGSFVQVAGISLNNLVSFTLRGYVRPTIVDEGTVMCSETTSKVGDVIGLAGELWLDNNGDRKGTGFGITKDGHVFARVETEFAPYSAEIISDDPLPVFLLPNPPAPWVRIKMTYASQHLTLEVEPDGGTLWMDTKTLSGGRVVVPVEKRFRIGARDEAPGNLTGCFSGRLDAFRLTGSYLGQPNDGVPQPGPNFTFAFEDGYGSNVQDTSGYGHTGTIMGHGTPGVEGRGGTQGLRLNHDQVIDAKFGTYGAQLDLSLATGAPLRSGLYVIYADGAGASPAEQYQCFVIRPTTPSAEARVAAIVPVNTWMAYNSWPGNAFEDNKYPIGLALRTCESFRHRAGNNSAYAFMADGTSANHYLAWRRPCPTANPFAGKPIGNTVFSVHAGAAVKFFEWLQVFADELGFSYDVYTDWDLDADAVSCPVKAMAPYKILFTMAHHEYWSQKMIQRVNDFADDGGSLINVGGNLFAYRAERSDDVIEIKAWPVRLYGNREQGPRDAQSLIYKPDWTGLWRVLNQCDQMSVPGATEDFVLGTIPDIVGPGSDPDGFGKWRPVISSHWLWQTPMNPTGIAPADFGASAALNGNGTVGHEGDSFVPGVMKNQMGVSLLPAKAGTHVVLAKACCDMSVDYLNYPGSQGGMGHIAFLTATCGGMGGLFELSQSTTFLDDFQFSVNLLSTPPAPDPERDVGTISYYCHNGGGHVLSIPSTACPWALGSPDTNDAVVKTMVQNAMRCILGINPPSGCGCPANDAHK